MKNFSSKEHIDIFEIIKPLWDKKLLILLACLIGFIVGAFISLNISDKYVSKAIISPKENQNNLQNSLLGDFGGFGLAQKSLSNTALAVEKMKTKSFIVELANEKDLTKDLLYSESWDRAKNTIKYKPATISNLVQRDELLFIKYSADFNVIQKMNSPFYELTFKSISPYKSKQILEHIISKVNLDMKTRDLQEIDSSIDYFSNELISQKNEYVRDAMVNVLKEELSNRSLIFNEDYVFEVIEPPTLAYKKSDPARSLIAIVISLCFAIVAIICVLFNNLLSRK